MRYIKHDADAPSSLAEAFKTQPHPENPREAWDHFDDRDLRAHLWELQFGLCAYCERVLGLEPGDSSIEHIIPKTENPQVTFEYTNLVLCCVSRNTCNLYKKGQHFAGFDSTGRWSHGFVAPNQPRCETSFEYLRDGSMDGIGNDKIDAKKNHRDPKSQRTIPKNGTQGLFCVS